METNYTNIGRDYPGSEQAFTHDKQVFATISEGTAL